MPFTARRMGWRGAATPLMYCIPAERTEEAGAVEPGAVVGGFVIERVAGRGGMGVVYRARQKQPDRIVALKVIAPDLAGDPEFRKRFERESAITAQIEHPNVIPVIAVGEEQGTLFIAMRYVDGTDLRTLIVQETRLEPRRAATLVDQVAQALDAAHRHGLVHRDVKPANVLISAAGAREHVYLTDFGLSRQMSGSQDLTRTGALLGTIDYVAPEQVRGGAVDARTDVYSLGCLLFHALSGSVPYPLESDLAKIYAHDSKPPPSLLERAPDVPPAFEAVVMRAMAKEPDARYLSAGDLGRAALAAASNATLSRAERSVAFGSAASSQATAVPTHAFGSETAGHARRPAAESAAGTGSGSGGGAQPASARGDRRRLLLGSALGVAAVAVALAVVLALSGGGRQKARAGAGVTQARTTASPPTSGPVTVGIVLGHSIGPVFLGERRGRVRSALLADGYRVTGTVGPNQVNYASPAHGVIVAQFDGRAMTAIQKYNDATIKVRGISINSTLRAARKALPDWRSVRCPKSYTLLIAPKGHTYFELPHGLDTTNASGSNGIVVSSTPADPSFC
jgi:predicted Ser/Thr protein kinase